MGSVDVRDLEDGEAFAGGGDGGRPILLRGEGLAQQLRAVGESGRDGALREIVGGDDLQVMSGRGLRETVLLCFCGERCSEGLRCLRFLVAHHGGEDGAAHLVKGSGVRGLLLFGLDDVIAELGLDRIGDLAGVQREGCLVEFGNGDAVLEHAELAALLLRAGIVGVLLRERIPVAAGAKLLEHIFGLGLRGCIGLGVRALGHGDEDVANLHLVGDLVVLEVLPGSTAGPAGR